ncbi:MAG: class I SAM-dependent DNA methyltransferase [Dehalococcoidia bacterium]
MNYKDWAEWYDIFYSSSEHEEENFYTAISKKVEGKILEIGVGTGRIAIRLAEIGKIVIGIDSSQEMIEKAKEKISAKNLSEKITLIISNMLSFNLNEKFDLIIIPANTLLLCNDEAEQTRVLINCQKHLTKNGKLIFNVYYPDNEMINENNKEAFMFNTIDINDGGRYILYSKNDFNINKQTNNSTQFIEKISIDGNVLFRKELKVKTRYLYPEDIIKLCENSNLSVKKISRDFLDLPVDQSADNIIVEARKIKHL